MALAFLFMGICGFGFLGFKETLQYNFIQNHGHPPGNLPIRSDLVLPMETAFLNRSELMTQIDEAFKGKEGIQTVALVGIGGSGKTTLARQYAHQQKAPLIWEINAETSTSLIESFENLAYVLAITEKDKGVLRELEEIKKSVEREKKLVQFVKTKLRLHSNWFLIYDNVEKFTDIQKYFPLDVETWGQGRVILTTRDSNIQNNKYVNHSLQMRELNEDQKLDLFTKILNQETKKFFNPTQIKEAKKFLREIPSFPLDVSIAAYYIKTSNVPYNQYLEGLKNNSTYLTNMQENILKESGEYTKSRYNIVSLSLQELIKSHEEFADLLLLIGLLDSQNIPKDLLNQYKKTDVVDNFIYNLKKHSLITTQSFPSSTESSLSIHRNTQAIILDYLTKNMKFKKRIQLMQSIANTLEHYVSDVIDKEDLSKMRYLLRHFERFLTHSNLLTDLIRGSIRSELGCIYFYQSDYIKSKENLEESLLNLNKLGEENHPRAAQVFVYLGNVYRKLGNYEKARILLEKSLVIYKERFPKNHAKVAWALTHLGNIHSLLGNHEKARNFLEESLVIYTEYFPENHIGIARALGFLGNAYSLLGNYEKAKNLFEQSLVIYREHFPENHVGVARALADVGYIHRKLGSYEKAEDLFAQSLKIYKKLYSENHIKTAWVLTNLGDVYTELGNYKKAKKLHEQSLIIYKNHLSENNIDFALASFHLGNTYKKMDDYEKARILFEQSFLIYKELRPEDCIETAYVLESLGQVYLLEGNLTTAEEFLGNALKIFQQNNHPSEYKCLESFSDLHLKKSDEARGKGVMEEAQNFKIQAINDLKKALDIIKTHFPEDSPHRARLESKIKNTEKL